MSAFAGLVAAAIIGRYASRRHPWRLMVGGYAAFFVLGLGFINAPPITTTMWVYLVLFAVTGFPNVTSQVGTTATAQALCPPDLLGRLSGLMSAAGAVGAGIGSITVAVLVDRVPVRVLFNGQTACFAVCALIGYLFVARRVADPQPAAPAPVPAAVD